MIHTTQECRIGDAVELLREQPAASVDTVVTSPPYHSLRDYQVAGQIGMEPTLEAYHNRLLEVTAEIKRVMKDSAVLFWNHGDSYGGSGGAGGDYNEGGLREGQPKVGRSINTTPKCLIMQNERLIMRMIDEQGFVLRNRIIWHKNNGMPSSVQDRFTNKYEPIYMLVKSNNPVYYCNSKTGAMQRDKPPGTNGDEGVDWAWNDVVSEDCVTGEVSTKHKKVSNWRGHDYWFDLDSVRVPHTWIGKKQKKPQTSVHRKKFDMTMGGGGSGFNGHSGSYKADGTPLNHPLGKNPGDVYHLESPEDDWRQLLGVASEIIGTETAISVYEAYMQSREVPADIWNISTQPFAGSHFAVFPSPLIEPMIRAACPAEICPVCGLPRVRMVDRVEGVYDGPSHQFGGKSHGGTKTNVANKQSPYYAAKTTGWTSCSCDAGWIAGTVLDPFCGSGTVLEVCRKLNRNAIGIELNPEYEPMIRERSMSHTPPLTAYLGGEPPEVEAL